MTDEFDFDARYTHPDFAGVALYATGYSITRAEFEEWGEGEIEDRDWVYVIMVGDDRKHLVEVSELTELDDDAYCKTCGQIGCTADA